MKKESNERIQQFPLTTNVLKGYLHTERRNKRCVLFVHGFTGNWDATWRAHCVTFPELILEDPELYDFDVFAFQYRTTWLRASPIQNIAMQLRVHMTRLASWANEKNRTYEVVFLAHRMGGLVCMRYILDRLRDGETPPIARLLLYGVPTTGTELVRLARLLGAGIGIKIPGFRLLSGLIAKGQRQVADLETASDFLQALHAEWAQRVVNGGYPRVSGARMWLSVRVVTGDDDWVVNEASGKGLYGTIDWHTLPYGHVALVKPETRNDERYEPLRSFLKACRNAKSPQILDRLWRLTKSVWQTHEKKLIHTWSYRLEMFSKRKHESQRQWIESGFAPCTVTKCEYATRLTVRTIRVAAAIGNIATRLVWDRDPVYVHQINVDAVPKEERERLIEWVDAHHAALNAQACWADMFPQFTLKMAHPIGSGTEVDLDYQKTERDGLVLVRYYVVPEERDSLVGEDVQIRIEYDSIIPAALTSFKLFFPWLTDGCDATIVINGSFNYFKGLSTSLA